MGEPAGAIDVEPAQLALHTDARLVGVLVRAVEQHVGTTAVGELASLKEAAAQAEGEPAP